MMDIYVGCLVVHKLPSRHSELQIGVVLAIHQYTGFAEVKWSDGSTRKHIITLLKRIA